MTRRLSLKNIEIRLKVKEIKNNISNNILSLNLMLNLSFQQLTKVSFTKDKPLMKLLQFFQTKIRQRYLKLILTMEVRYNNRKMEESDNRIILYRSLMDKSFLLSITITHIHNSLLMKLQLKITICSKASNFN